MLFIKRILNRFKHHHQIVFVDNHMLCAKCNKTFQIPAPIPPAGSLPVALTMVFSDGNTYLCTDLFTDRTPIWEMIS
jgi:hypothetical protein